MRNVVYKDLKIKDKDYNQVISDYTAFLKKNAGITPTFTTIDYDFTDYPIEFDSDGDIRPKQSFLSQIHDLVFKKFSGHGADYVITLIHEDNWSSSGINFDKLRTANNMPTKKGIWGTAWAYRYREYLTLYCRWDKKNMANNFGTIYHEACHPLDVLIKVELGIDINKIVESELRVRYKDNHAVISYLNKNGFLWDRDFVHGAINPPLQYIRYQENTEIISIAKTYIQNALRKRGERHLEYISLQKKVITLAEKVIYLLRQKLYKKDGVSLS